MPWIQQTVDISNFIHNIDDDNDEGDQKYMFNEKMIK